MINFKFIKVKLMIHKVGYLYLRNYRFRVYKGKTEDSQSRILGFTKL